MTRRNSFYVLVFISTILTGCFGFDTNTRDNIIGNYYVISIDDSEESLNYNTNKGGGGFSTVLVAGSVYEVLWNDNFILTKQHPVDSVAELAYNHIRYKLWRDTVKTMNLADNSKLYLDTLLKKQLTALQKQTFKNELKKG